MSGKKLSTVAWDALKGGSVMGHVLKLAEPMPEKVVMDEIRSVLRPHGGAWKGGSVSGFVFKDKPEGDVRMIVEEVLDRGYESFTEVLDKTDLKSIVLPVGELKAILNKCGEVVPEKSILPATENVLLKIKGGRVVIIGTDTVVTVIGDIAFSGAHDDTNFSCLVPYKVLNDFVKNLEGDELKMRYTEPGAIFSTDEDKLILEELDDVKLFPTLPAFPEENELRINDDLVHWLKKSLLTVSKDGARPSICKVCMRIGVDKLTIATTNSWSLFEKGFELPVDTEMGAPVRKVELLINPVVVGVLSGYSEISIYWNGSHVGFKAGNITITGTLQDEKFPDYESVFPKKPYNIVLHRESLVHVLEKMSITGAPWTDIYLLREEGYVCFEALDIDRARKVVSKIKVAPEGDVPGRYTGDVEKILLSPKQLLPVLKQQGCTDIRMAIHGANVAVLLTDADDPLYRALIMPMRRAGE